MLDIIFILLFVAGILGFDCSLTYLRFSYERENLGTYDVNWMTYSHYRKKLRIELQMLALTLLAMMLSFVVFINA